jgi:hypothetical protein
MVDIFQYLIILMFIPIILIISYITEQLLLRKNLGPFGSFITGLRFIGVLIHELCHFLMCLLVGVRPSGIQVRLRSRQTGEAAPHGKVTVDINSLHKMTFLQATLIALAPIIIATWLFFWCLTLMFSETLEPLLRIMAGFICISLLLGCCPSIPDFRFMGRSFKKDPKYSLYQAFLVLLSIFLVWFIISYYAIMLPLDIFFYILVGICYYPLKYSLHGINKLMYIVFSKRSSTIDYKSYTRKRFKPVRPIKLKTKETRWSS